MIKTEKQIRVCTYYKCVHSLYAEQKGGVRLKDSKFHNYELTASVHTLQIWTHEEVNQEALKQLMSIRAIKSYRCSLNGEKKFLILNLNKIDGDIFSFREFCQVFTEVKNFLGIQSYHLQRADFRLDSYEPGFYEKFFKVTRYLLSGFDSAFILKNGYKAEDLYSTKNLSLALKGVRLQLEYYDRNSKNVVTSNVTEPAQARLEFRSLPKIWGGYRRKYPDTKEIKFIQQEFQKAWRKRLEKAIEALEPAEYKFNQVLIARWQAGQADKRYRNYIDFLRENQELIFTRRQAVGLLKEIGITNPKKAIDNFVDRYRPELFLKKEIFKVQREIQKSTRDYFRN